MLHLVLYGLLAVILAGGLFLVAARFLPAGEQIAPPLRDEPPWDLPAERTLEPDDVDSVRLPVALRGYRFAETDMLLDRLAGELRARDEQIARLRGDGASSTPFGPAVDDDERGAPDPAAMAAEPAAEAAAVEPAAGAAAVEPAAGAAAVGPDASGDARPVHPSPGRPSPARPQIVGSAQGEPDGDDRP